MPPKTAPFHWSGEFPAPGDFMDVDGAPAHGRSQVLDAEMAAKLAAFMDAIPAPDNPYQRAN